MDLRGEGEGDLRQVGTHRSLRRLWDIKPLDAVVDHGVVWFAEEAKFVAAGDRLDGDWRIQIKNARVSSGQSSGDAPPPATVMYGWMMVSLAPADSVTAGVDGSIVRVLVVAAVTLLRLLLAAPGHHDNPGRDESGKTRPLSLMVFVVPLKEIVVAVVVPTPMTRARSGRRRFQ